MSFDIAREMSGKSITSPIAGDDTAVRPRSFRRAGAALPGAHCREERGCRRGTRPSGSRATAIASIRYALDRHRSRAAWFRKAGKPAVDIARQFVAGPAFADASWLARFVRNRFQSYPFGPRSHFEPFDLSHLTGWLPRRWAYALIGGTEIRDAEARPHHF